MKLSARNQLNGKITEITPGPVSTRVKIEVAGGTAITSSITSEAAKDLGLKVGDTVSAIIKASDVMIGK